MLLNKGYNMKEITDTDRLNWLIEEAEVEYLAEDFENEETIDEDKSICYYEDGGEWTIWFDNSRYNDLRKAIDEQILNK